MQRRISLIAVLTASALGCGPGFGHNPGAGASRTVEIPADAPPGSTHNPFSGARYFLNPDQTALIEATARHFPSEADLIRRAAAQPTALWLDSISKVARVPPLLEEAKKQQEANGQPTLSVFVLYDLPNRDCAAKSSAGELKVEANGEARYRTEFIDPIVRAFRKYPDLPIVAILEPDSLGNLATNMNNPYCADSRAAYKNGVVYAIKQLALPNVSVYLDAAHSGWLGWDENRDRIAKVYKSVLRDAGGPHMIRGFATNISNYTHLSNRDGAGLEPTNPCPNELTYIRRLGQSLSDHGIKGKGFIIDTSRNGRGGIRAAWGAWCNIKGAGLGERPRADPEPGVDAYFWVKPPGESDGSSDPSQPRFDTMCASNDSAKNAPQAGKWFEAYFMDLVHNATPPL